MKGLMKGTMVLKTQQSVFIEKLKDLYSAENQLLRVLPKMAKVASTPQLRQALTDRLHQTQVQLHRLDRIFLRLGAGPKGSECAAMESMIAETRNLMGEEIPGASLDAALIAAVQRFEHFEAAGYASAHTFAKQLGHNTAADSLRESLSEKADTDKTLTELAIPAVTMGVHDLNGKS